MRSYQHSEGNNLLPPVETRTVLYLPEAVLAILHDPQSVVGPLAFAVELNVTCQSFQLYLSPKDTHTHTHVKDFNANNEPQKAL